MPTQLLTLGLSHVTAPLDVRERLAFSAEQIGSVLVALRSAFGGSIKEAALLSTCNRTELYCNIAPEITGWIPEQMSRWLSDFRQVPLQQIHPHLYQYTEQHAIRHAFRVASGLESMVLGEPQILGQIKQAAQLAEQSGSMGTLLHQLFQRTFAVAKEVRSQTAIGEQSVSTAAATVRLTQRIFDDFSSLKILFVGAGDMIDLCATHFAAHQPAQIWIANRTQAKANALAHRLKGQAMLLADLPERFAEFDVIVSCTASTLPLIGLGMVERATKIRRHKPIMIMDLAVPRDVEAEVARLDDVYLYTIDDLGKLVHSASQARHAAVTQAEAIIETRVQGFMHWLENRTIVPIIQQLNQSAEALCMAEVGRAQRRLAQGEPTQQVLQSLAESLTHKYLHGPLTALNESDGSTRQQLLAWLPRLFPLQSRRRKS